MVEIRSDCFQFLVLFSAEFRESCYITWGPIVLDAIKPGNVSRQQGGWHCEFEQACIVFGEMFTSIFPQLHSTLSNVPIFRRDMCQAWERGQRLRHERLQKKSSVGALPTTKTKTLQS